MISAKPGGIILVALYSLRLRKPRTEAILPVAIAVVDF